MEEDIKISKKSSIIKEIQSYIIIIVAAIAVQMLSNYTLNVAKYLVYPFAGVVKPILVGIEFLKDLTDGIGEPPDIIKKLGGFRLILFMIAVLTATISMIKEITMTADLHTLLEIVLLNTSVGGLMAIFEGVEISITVCMDILLFSIFTGWFVSHCLKLSLPIQLLYDSNVFSLKRDEQLQADILTIEGTGGETVDKEVFDKLGVF